MKIFARIVRIAVIALSIWLLAGCATGLRAYQRGDYYKASMQAVQRLRSKPDNRKARTALANAYPLAVSNAKRAADNALASQNLSQIDGIVAIFSDMNRLADEIHHSPAALAIIPEPVEFHEELRLAKDLVAEMSYQAGIKALSEGTMEQARAAYRHFTLVNQYVPGYKDVISRMEEARYAATLRVVVTRPVTNPQYALNAEFFYTRLMNDITKRTYRNFVRFYTPEEAQSLGMNDPHELLILNFEDFTVGNVLESIKETELRRDSVIVGTTKVNGVTHNVYGTVKAKYTLNRIEIVSQGILSVRILNPSTNRVMRHSDFAGRSVWHSEWASFNGDERALSREQLELTKRKPLPPPPPQELFVSFADPLYSKAAQYIAAMY